MERAWHIWALEQATDWHWPPDVLEQQDERLMRDLMRISIAYGRVKESQNGEQ